MSTLLVLIKCTLVTIVNANCVLWNWIFHVDEITIPPNRSKKKKQNIRTTECSECVHLIIFDNTFETKMSTTLSPLWTIDRQNMRKKTHSQFNCMKYILTVWNEISALTMDTERYRWTSYIEENICLYYVLKRISIGLKVQFL